MTASSANPSSASEALLPPGHSELHLWLERRESLADSGVFIRDVLSRYTGLAPTALGFGRGPHGKPSIVDSCEWLAFNFSDSGDWLALAVSGGPEVGVDLERCDPQRDVLRLARRCYGPAEIADLEACDASQRSARFYDYWTLKEARVKALGGALGRELQATRFALEYPAPGGTGETRGLITPLFTDTGPAWYGLLQPLPGYRLALCCRADGNFSPGLRQFTRGEGGAGRPVELLASSISHSGITSLEAP